MEEENGKIVILGAGIGGLTAAFELLKNGKKVVIIEKEMEAGGLARGIESAGFHVDLGYKQFYSRIPSVNSFLREVLDGQLTEYENRIGIFHTGRIYERDKKYRGVLRGMPVFRLLTGCFDLIFHKLKYLGRKKHTMQDVAWSQKGRLFSQIFSQGFDEKLKGRPWSSVDAEKISIVNGVRKFLPLGDLFHEISKGGSKQKEWYHPRKGSGGLIETLQNKIQEMGGEIKFNNQLVSILKRGDRIESVEIESEGVVFRIETACLISGIRIETLTKSLGLKFGIGQDELSFQRGNIIIYLFFDDLPGFPHTCLHVSDPNLKVGRVTNYAAYNCGMVPEGKSCLAFEIFCKKGDILFQYSDKDLIAIVGREFGKSKIVDLQKVKASKIVRLFLADAANANEDFKEGTRKKMYEDLSQIQNLYYVNRNGVDKTIYTSIRAAEGILGKGKNHFLKFTSPLDDEPWKISS